MKVNVKLYGTLSQGFPGYQPERGIEVEIRDGATAMELLANMGISKSQGAVVSVEGLIFNPEDRLPENAPISVLQAVHGG